MFTSAPGRLCGRGFLSLPPPETKLQDASPKQEGPGVVGRPTGWDVQAREGRDPAKDSRLPGGDSAQPRERVLAEAGAWGE